MYKKAWCTSKVVVLLNKPIALFSFSLLSPLSLLKLPSDDGDGNNDDDDEEEEEEDDLAGNTNSFILFDVQKF